MIDVRGDLLDMAESVRPAVQGLSGTVRALTSRQPHGLPTAALSGSGKEARWRKSVRSVAVMGLAK